jgi:hypothetical protein
LNPNIELYRYADLLLVYYIWRIPNVRGFLVIPVNGCLHNRYCEGVGTVQWRSAVWGLSERQVLDDACKRSAISIKFPTFKYEIST